MTRLKWPPSSAPYLPLAISLRAWAYSGNIGSTWPIRICRLARSAAFTMRWQSATVSAMGFSQNTCLPCSRACTAALACADGGRQMSTRSTVGSANRSSSCSWQMHLRHVDQFAARAEIALDVAPVARQSLLVLFAQRDDRAPATRW